MERNYLKKVLCLVLTMVLISCTCLSVFGAESASASTDNSEIEPYTYYLYNRYIDMEKSGSYIKVTVDTVATQNVQHIYHDITIFKNGV